MAEAEAIATREYPRLQSIARQRGVFSSAFSPGSGSVGSRNIGIRFVLTKEDASGVVLASVIVDLVEQRLISYEDGAARELNS